MSELDNVLKSYAEFEFEVIGFTSGFLLPWCADCRGGCCQADCCREVLDSPFLTLLQSRYPPLSVYSDGEGWLTQAGCALTAVRPPVCYEFICDRVFEDQPSDIYRYGMDILARLISHVGKGALGRRHIVEIMDPSDLSAIRFDRFNRRLIEARQAFEAVKAILTGTPLTETATATLL